MLVSVFEESGVYPVETRLGNFRCFVHIILLGVESLDVFLCPRSVAYYLGHFKVSRRGNLFGCILPDGELELPFFVRRL